jgi:hypothetical protein
MVQVQSALAGSAFIATLLAGIEPHGKVMAAHPQEWNSRFFGCLDALLATLTRVFGEMQFHPELIQSYLTPFLLINMSLYLCAAVYPGFGVSDLTLDYLAATGLAREEFRGFAAVLESGLPAPLPVYNKATGLST